MSSFIINQTMTIQSSLYKFLKLHTILVTLILCLFSVSAFAEMLQASDSSHDPIDNHMQYFHERDGILNLHEAQSAFDLDIGMPVKNRIAGFGLGTKPTWLKLQIINSKEKNITRNLLIENSWLDSVDIYIINNGNVVESVKAGDYLNFKHRPINSRFFSIQHSYPAGISDIYIRVETHDPLTLPIYFLSPKDVITRDSYHAYTYGLLYGAALSLLLYNLMLFVGMKNKRYLYFSLYLISFLIMNLSYTGHGFQWLWPEHPTFQRWANPIFMMVFNLCGFLFAASFLNIKSHMPKTYRVLFIYCCIFSMLQALAITLDNHLWSINLAFLFMLLFSSIMLFFGITSLKFEQCSARYFLLASAAGATGSTITACAVLGWIPYTELTYRAVDIGIMLDMVLLALALSEQFKIKEKEKTIAELMAQADPLTGLNNRHTFNEKVKTLWALSQRNHQSRSIIIFDIDRLKLVNNYYGYKAGDHVLEEVGKMLTNLTRSSDVSARWGGDKFILFSIDNSIEHVMTLAEKIRDAIEECDITVNNDTFTVTASFGIACYQSSDKQLNQLIAEADDMLSQSKSGGGNLINY